jgi:hypothetical protein
MTSSFEKYYLKTKPLTIIVRGFAERKGFEPSIRFPVYTLSRRAPSTTRTPLCICYGEVED